MKSYSWFFQLKYSTYVPDCLQSEILSHDPHTSMSRPRSLASLCITHLPFIAFLCSASAWCQTVGRSRIYSLPAERMHAHGACITRRGQRPKNEHCIPQWQRGGGYPLSINTARHSSSRPSPLCLFTATGKSMVAMETQLWVASRPSLPAVTVVSLPRWAQRAEEKNSSLIRKQDVITPFPLFLLLTITIPAVYS